jgi:hypothetical protein
MRCYDQDHLGILSKRLNKKADNYDISLKTWQGINLHSPGTGILNPPDMMKKAARF